MGFLKKPLERLLGRLLRRYPEIALQALKQWPPRISFANVPDIPQRNFEDLAWMFVSNPTNKGLLLLEFDEAAFLFHLARSKPAAQILEIGRYFGGSAFLLAVGSDDNSVITSIDIAPQNDDLLRSALERHGLLHKVNLIIGDSREAAPRKDFYDLIFIDGDHFYEGVAQDYQIWGAAVKPGGYLALHNAAAARPHAGVAPGPARLVSEITRHDREQYTRQPDVGSLAIFIRTQKM